MNSSSGRTPQGVRVAPLQRAWLREIGVDRPWLPDVPQAPAGKDSAAAARPDAGGQATGRAASASPGSAPSRDQASRNPGAASGSPATAMQRPARPAPVAGIAVAAAAATRPEVGSADLDQLREQVLACTACGLCSGRRQAVFGDGARPARWMVVGEAPGEQEDRQGLPFVGRSGQLLDAMLGSIGMSRQRDVYIANVIKCRPPGNRNPKPEEIAACSPYLMRQIELLRPERILVLGRFAAQTLLGTDASIGSLRGRLHRIQAGERDIPVVVSYHPAYLLRSPNEKSRAWQDLQLAMRPG